MKKSNTKKQKIIMIDENDDYDYITELKRNRRKKLPKTAQETIPFAEIYENGIFRTNATFSLVFRIRNIDYRMMRDTNKDEVYAQYQNMLNTMPTEINYQEFLMNTVYDFDKLRSALIPKNTGEYPLVYESYCDIVHSWMERCRNNSSELILLGAISFEPENKLDDISVLFSYFEEIQKHLMNMGSSAEILKPLESFAVLHQFYHPLDDEEFLIPSDYFRNDVDLKSYIVPAGFDFKSKNNRDGRQVIMGIAYTRVLFVKRFNRFNDDEFLYDLLNNNYKIVVSKHIRRLEKEDSIEMLKLHMDDIEGKIEKRREANAKRGTGYIPWRIREQEKEVEGLQDTISSSDADLHEFLMLIRVSASSLKELNELTKYVRTKGVRHGVVIDVAALQQENALNTCLPLAINYLNSDMNNYCMFLPTAEIGNIIPFSFDNHFSPDGISYGVNQQTNNITVINRCDELNANAFVLGTSGSGKSMFVKEEAISTLIKYTNDELIIIDPENEYLPLLNELDGERIVLSPSSSTNINVFDTDISFNEEGSDFRALKSEFIMNFCEMAKGRKLESKETSVIDRCVKLCYKDFQEHNGDKDYLPTLEVFFELLKEQPEPQAKDIMLDIEVYVTGSFSNFAKKTNINYNKRFLIFDIFQMGEQLKKVGLQVLLEIIWQRVILNKQKGVRTWLWCDEFSVMFGDKAELQKSGDFFQKVFSRIRKYGGVATAATQNITSILQNKQATTMLNNAECVVLLQQKPTDLKKIIDLFSLSVDQAKYISKGKDGVGQGLYICGRSIIPFDNRIPTDSFIYKLCSTKFDDQQRQQMLAKGEVFQ